MILIHTIYKNYESPFIGTKLKFFLQVYVYSKMIKFSLNIDWLNNYKNFDVYMSILSPKIGRNTTIIIKKSEKYFIF